MKKLTGILVVLAFVTGAIISSCDYKPTPESPGTADSTLTGTTDSTTDDAGGVVVKEGETDKTPGDTTPR